jgi:hypothetical protein
MSRKERAMSISPSTDYQVGYRKPPQRTQFTKGQSGNPKGRAKGSKNLSTLLTKALNEQVVINESGRRKTITKLEATMKQLVNTAAGGDARAIKLVTDLLQQIGDKADCGPKIIVLSQNDMNL